MNISFNQFRSLGPQATGSTSLSPKERKKTEQTVGRRRVADVKDSKGRQRQKHRRSVEQKRVLAKGDVEQENRRRKFNVYELHHALRSTLDGKLAPVLPQQDVREYVETHLKDLALANPALYADLYPGDPGLKQEDSAKAGGLGSAQMNQQAIDDKGAMRLEDFKVTVSWCVGTQDRALVDLL